MGYTLVKNLKVNKNTGIISGDFADSNTFDWDNKHVYEHLDDIYQDKEGKRSPLQKYSRFISDIIAGNLQDSIGKYNRLSIPNYYNDLSYFMRENENNGEDPFVLTYLKYQEEIEKTLTDNPQYIINEQYYVGYKFKCMNLDKHLEKEYNGGHLTISYFLDSKNTLKKELYIVEKKFEKDILNYEKSKTEETEEDEI